MSTVNLHFNRINMQRGDKRVWSGHTSKSCNMAEKIVIRHRGKVVAETIFKPEKKQNPRAFIKTKGELSWEDGTLVVDVR